MKKTTVFTVISLMLFVLITIPTVLAISETADADKYAAYTSEEVVTAGSYKYPRTTAKSFWSSITDTSRIWFCRILLTANLSRSLKPVF